MTRIIAAALAVFFLGLVALMASVTLFVRDPMPVLSARAPVAIERDGIRTSVAMDPTYRFDVTAEGLPRDTAADLTMRRGEADGRAVEVEITEAGAGRVRASGQFTAPGRWTLTLVGRDGPVDFGFVVQE